MKMSEALNLKKVVEDIVSSYETRVEGISSVFDSTPLIFSDFQQSILDTKEEREKINAELRECLAKNESLRRKDFDNMMQGILSTQDQRGKGVRDLLKSYLNEQREMAHALRDNLAEVKGALAKGEVQRVKDSHGVIKEILARQEERKNEVISKLKELQKEQRDLAVRLKELLAKGNNLRIRDFKSMLKEFKIQREARWALQKKRKEDVAEMLGSFRKGRKRDASLSEAVHPPQQMNSDHRHQTTDIRQKDGSFGLPSPGETRPTGNVGCVPLNAPNSFKGSSKV